MASFEIAVQYVLENEGGFVVDSGGPTNFGITVPVLAKFLGKREREITASDIRNLSLEMAKDVYEDRFWKPLLLDQVNSQAIATALLDIGVNRGLSVARIYAQKACRLLGQHIPLDGIFGPNTIAAINSLDGVRFVHALQSFALAGYIGIAQSNPFLKQYLKGWETRAKRLLSLI